MTYCHLLFATMNSILKKPHLRRCLSGTLMNGVKHLCQLMPKVYGSEEVYRTHMLNGIRVAAAQSLGAQLSACTIMFQAGSRLERDNQLGASHFVRAMSGSSGHAYSAVGKGRVLQQRGCNLTCSGDRQTLAFTLRCPFTQFHDLKYFLIDTATRCCFYEWEVTDIKPFIKDNLLRMSSEQRAIDLVQKAFWAGPLHQSIFCDEVRVDSMTSANLKEFVTNFTPNNCTVTSCGIPFEDTLKLAEILHLQCVQDVCCEQEQKFSFPRGGYEVHDLGSGSETCTAVAVLGCGTQDLCCLMKHAILAATWEMLFVQLRERALDKIVRDKTPLGCQSDELYPTYEPFNVSYMETGVFGVLAKSHSINANKVAITAAQLLANVDKIDVEHISYGKKRLKLNLAINEENCVNISENLALQMANRVHIDGPLKAYKVIDSIPNEEVLQLAKDIVSRKSDMAFAVVGDVDAVSQNDLYDCRR